MTDLTAAQEESVKMLQNQQQPQQLHQVVTLLDNAKDLLDQNKSQDKIYPRLSMQTEIR